MAKALLRDCDHMVGFDTEQLGCALRPALSHARPVKDFQDWPAWRRLVVTALTEIVREEVGDVVVPQTVLVQPYWAEISAGLAQNGVDGLAVTLHVEHAEHLRRIKSDMLSRPAVDQGRLIAAEWRRSRRGDYDAALPWLRARTCVIDTTTVPADRVAQQVMQARNSCHGIQ